MISKVRGDISEIFREAESNSPWFILSCLDDEGHDEGFVLIPSEYLWDLFEALDCEDSNLILLVGGPVFEDADEVAENVFFLIDFTHLGDLGGCDSLQKKHFLIWDICEFAVYVKGYCLIFYLLGPALG